MALLLLSIVVLWSAPFLYKLASRYTRAHRIVERALLIALAVMVIVDILPNSYRVAGVSALIVAIWGMAVPSIAERVWRSLAEKVHWVPLLFGTLGLALHASIDGAAFVNPAHSHQHHSWLPFAVIFHRFFEGLFIWWALTPRFGTRVSAAVLLFSSGFTLVGYALGDHYFHSLESNTIYSLFQALVAGSLLHLALDRHDHDGVHAHHGHDANHHH